jgi:hypothetical protein
MFLLAQAIIVLIMFFIKWIEDLINNHYDLDIISLSLESFFLTLDLFKIIKLNPS